MRHFRPVKTSETLESGPKQGESLDWAVKTVDSVDFHFNIDWYSGLGHGLGQDIWTLAAFSSQSLVFYCWNLVGQLLIEIYFFRVFYFPRGAVPKHVRFFSSCMCFICKFMKITFKIQSIVDQYKSLRIRMFWSQNKKQKVYSFTNGLGSKVNMTDLNDEWFTTNNYN